MYKSGDIFFIEPNYENALLHYQIISNNHQTPNRQSSLYLEGL